MMPTMIITDHNKDDKMTITVVTIAIVMMLIVMTIMVKAIGCNADCDSRRLWLPRVVIVNITNIYIAIFKTTHLRSFKQYCLPVTVINIVPECAASMMRQHRNKWFESVWFSILDHLVMKSQALGNEQPRNNLVPSISTLSWTSHTHIHTIQSIE